MSLLNIGNIGREVRNVIEPALAPMIDSIGEVNNIADSVQSQLDEYERKLRIVIIIIFIVLAILLLLNFITIGRVFSLTP